MLLGRRRKFASKNTIHSDWMISHTIQSLYRQDQKSSEQGGGIEAVKKPVPESSALGGKGPARARDGTLRSALQALPEAAGSNSRDPKRTLLCISEVYNQITRDYDRWVCPKTDMDRESSRGSRNVQKHRNLHKLQTIVWYAWWVGFHRSARYGSVG